MARRRNSNNRAPKPEGQIRIISGQWRGRKLPVHDLEGLRPTTDRQKETLFNWLQGEIDGAKVLDLYAGAGGLGFEALSRHAASLVAVEKDGAVAAQLKANGNRLGANNMSVVNADVLAYLNNPTDSFDLLFIDPPFRQQLLHPTLEQLTPWLTDTAWIYIETESGLSMPELSTAWELWREKVAGQSHARLYRFTRQ